MSTDPRGFGRTYQHQGSRPSYSLRSRQHSNLWILDDKNRPVLAQDFGATLVNVPDPNMSEHEQDNGDSSHEVSGEDQPQAHEANPERKQPDSSVQALINIVELQNRRIDDMMAMLLRQSQDIRQSTNRTGENEASFKEVVRPPRNFRGGP